MRYLFRGRREDGTWVQGHLAHNKYSNTTTPYIGHLTMNGEEWYAVDPATIGQCTGVVDERDHNAFIWEGDIIKQREYDDVWVVEWRDDRQNTGWNATPPDSLGVAGHFPFGYNQDLYAIGNIHDNPELIKPVSEVRDFTAKGITNTKEVPTWIWAFPNDEDDVDG